MSDKRSKLFLKTDDPEAEFNLISFQITEVFKGIKNSQNNLYVTSGFSFTESSDLIEINIDKTLGEYFSEKNDYMELEYLSGWGDVSVEIVFESGETLKHFMLYPIPGENSQKIFYSSLGFIPEKIRINKHKNIFRFKGMEINTVLNEAWDSDVGIYSYDLASILNTEYSEDDKKDFSLYKWDLFPEVLIFDFLDYEIQSRYLKRLAFFTEKEGHVGKILPDSIIADKHGWNAHDYKPYDLAMFFHKAELENFKLNSQEELLKNILLKNGIIIYQNDEYLPGNGAVVSITRESAEYLRRQLLNHECLHGIFFVDEAFRLSCFQIWDQLPEIEKNFWIKYFDYLKYDVKNKYLLVNEFMAYHLQQNINAGEKYFTNTILPKFKRKYPEAQEYAYAEARSPDFFIKNQASLNRALIKASGKDLSNIVYFYEIKEQE